MGALHVADLVVRKRQIALQAGDLPSAVATESILSPLAGVILGIALFEESLHEETWGVILTLLSLTAMAAGIAMLAKHQGRTPGG